MGHRVAVLAGGRLQQCDTPRHLYDNPVNQFVAGFIGSPAMNLQTVPLADGGARLAGTTLPLPAAVRTAARQAGLSELVIGIRPEHLHLAEGAGELAGEVMLVEELGADALLHVRLAGGGNPVVARAEGRKPPSPGQQVTFHVQPDDVLAFHPGTGARLQAEHGPRRGHPGAHPAGRNPRTATAADGGPVRATVLDHPGSFRPGDLPPGPAPHRSSSGGLMRDLRRGGEPGARRPRDQIAHPAVVTRARPARTGRARARG